MKLLIVTGIFPPDHGGPASYVPAIATALKARGHDVVAIVTLSDHLEHDDGHYEFPVVRLHRARPRLLRMISTVLTIGRQARRADVVYLNGLVLEGIVASLLTRTPAVIKVVSDLIWDKAHLSGATGLGVHAFQTARLPLHWRALRRLQAWYTAQASAIIVPSVNMKGLVEHWGIYPHKIQVIPNAVRPLPPRARPPSPVRYDLVTVGRLIPVKCIADLIAVAAENGWSLRVVGDGPLRGELEVLATKLRAQASFAGHLPPERVYEEMSSARLFVLNSSHEGLPHVVLEAKAVGVPVIATAVGGTPEVIRHDEDGWLVPAGDRAALAAAIRRVLADEALRARLAERALQQIRDKFSFDAMVSRTAAVLELARKSVVVLKNANAA